MKHPESKGLVAGLVLVLGGAAWHADPAEDRAVQAVVKWGGRITREEAAEGRPVVGVDLESSQKMTDAGLKELKHLESLRRQILIGDEVDPVTVESIHGTEEAVAQPCGTLHNCVEDRLDSRRRAGNHTQDLGRRGLLLQRLGQIGGALF